MTNAVAERRVPFPRVGSVRASALVGVRRHAHPLVVALSFVRRGWDFIVVRRSSPPRALAAFVALETHRLPDATWATLYERSS
jgi:hypothetical protein